jgi:citrate/tricarballylate utilization protein
MPDLDIFEEANRQLIICNACRYCEGFCPVFRAIEMRREFGKGDVFYLSNLCHDCRACYYACMYTPPHEFAVNIPKILAEARVASYEHWSWPAFLARSFRESRVGMLLAGFVAAFVAVLCLYFIPFDRLFAAQTGPGAFYRIIPYLAMVMPAVALVVYGFVIWMRGSFRFWSETQRAATRPAGLKTTVAGLADAAMLRYLKGGGPGCTYPGERPSESRRVYHALVFWGFLFDFVSTILAFIYQDVFDRLPPYPLTSGPVVFGTLGGIALVFGVAGLIGLKFKSDRAPAGAGAYGLDYTFLVVVGLTPLTGLLTLTLRETAALGSLLIAHLAMVAALFLTAPYGKFVHALYRSLALLKYRAEENPAQRGVLQDSREHALTGGKFELSARWRKCRMEIRTPDLFLRHLVHLVENFRVRACDHTH